MTILPPRPEHPRNCGVSEVLGYLKDLEKWVNEAGISEWE